MSQITDEMVGRVAAAIKSKLREASYRTDEITYEEVARAALDAAQKAAEADGWVMVPREPTEEMIEASWVRTKTRTREEYMAVALATTQQAHHHKAKGRYKAMIAAAPTFLNPQPAREGSEE